MPMPTPTTATNSGFGSGSGADSVFSSQLRRGACAALWRASECNNNAAARPDSCVPFGSLAFPVPVVVVVAFFAVQFSPFCGALCARRDLRRFMGLDIAAVNGSRALLSR